MTTTNSRRREKIVRNIIARHGRGGLHRLITGLQAGESGQTIGTELGVTRERVRQWKGLLGDEVRTYIICEEVQRVLNLKETEK